MPLHEFVVAVMLWPGIDLFHYIPGAWRCVCGDIIDSSGDHLLGCRYDALGRILTMLFVMSYDMYFQSITKWQDENRGVHKT